MRKMKQLLLVLLCLLLTGCSLIGSDVPESIKATPVPGQEAVQPDAREASGRIRSNASTLWFRFGTTGHLAPESRTIVHTLNESYELVLMRALVAGPDVRNTELDSLFPEGTTVLNASVSGHVLYVTFSEELLHTYADEPKNWDSDSHWSVETPLRRKLCMQSIIATASENCNVNLVQVLVESRDGTTTRLPLSYYPETVGELLPADSLWRDDTYLLTPDRTVSCMMEALSSRDWETLYRYICLNDPETGADRPGFTDFVTVMESSLRLVSETHGAGSVSVNGDRVTYTVQPRVLKNGRKDTFDNRMLRLYRENSIWKTTVSVLTQMLEVRND